MRAERPVLLLRYAFCLAVGLLLGSSALQFAAPGQTSARRASIPYTMRERLGANLYMQTAAEYRACCLQTYHLAQLRLAALMAAKPARPAVVMDLDETVLDNSAYESYLYESGRENSQERWLAYERDYPDRVALVPGAKPFIEKAEALGATLVYISNRAEKYRAATIQAAAARRHQRRLHRGPPVPEDRHAEQGATPRSGCGQVQRVAVLRRQPARFLRAVCGDEAHRQRRRQRLPQGDSEPAGAG